MIVEDLPERDSAAAVDILAASRTAAELGSGIGAAAITGGGAGVFERKRFAIGFPRGV
jgi:hypothetical protein